ncbi:MAG: hypothetical protein KGO96_00080 [Elusimicrobia bacterium]|nr:hypothetical protein [Elusimicrobiota bacterium]MDE2424290.1 hypothetical protein [Elusimicrobiota bacterium]
MRASPALLLALAAALAACGPAKEREPNDDFSTATPIKPGRVEGTLSSASDVDFYRIDNDEEPAALSAHLSGIREADFVVSVFDKNRRELKRYDETGVGGDEDVEDVGLKEGPSYIRISNKNPAFANPTQKYVLTTRLQRGPGHETEPDETPQTASALEVPGVTRGHYFPSRDLLSQDTSYPEVDWYAINVPQSGLFLLDIDVSGVPGVDPEFEIYDANGYLLKQVEGGGQGLGVSLKNFGVHGPARYHLRLRALDGASNPDVAYEILTELLPYDGRVEFEPNDQRVDATALTGGSISGTIAPAGDQDWYKVSVTTDEKQLLSANVTGVDGVDLVLRAADALGDTILTVDNAGQGQPETLTGLGVAKGDYYLIVSDKSGRLANPNEPYVLTARLDAWQPGLEYELDDSTASAQPINIGESVDGYFGWAGDVDCYRFNVYSKGTVVFELAGVLNVQPTATLLDQDGRPIKTWTADKPGKSLLFERELEAGTYTLRLAAQAGQDNVRDKYSLRLKIR